MALDHNIIIILSVIHSDHHFIYAKHMVVTSSFTTSLLNQIVYHPT